MFGWNDFWNLSQGTNIIPEFWFKTLLNFRLNGCDATKLLIRFADDWTYSANSISLSYRIFEGSTKIHSDHIGTFGVEGWKEMIIPLKRIPGDHEICAQVCSFSFVKNKLFCSFWIPRCLVITCVPKSSMHSIVHFFRFLPLPNIHFHSSFSLLVPFFCFCIGSSSKSNKKKSKVILLFPIHKYI